MLECFSLRQSLSSAAAALRQLRLSVFERLTPRDAEHKGPIKERWLGKQLKGKSNRAAFQAAIMNQTMRHLSQYT